MHLDGRSKEGSVYCNGALHWIRGSEEKSLPWCSLSDGRDGFGRDRSDVLHYFDIGEETLRLAAATPPVPLFVKNTWLGDIGFRFPFIVHRYCGESGGRLYLIEIYNLCNTLFEVMEMETGYSGWFVKYHVDLNTVFAALPGSSSFVVLCLRLENEKESEVEDSSTHVMFHMPGKIISYNLWNKTFKTSVELSNKDLFSNFR